METEVIALSEVKETQRDKYRALLLISEKLESQSHRRDKWKSGQWKRGRVERAEGAVQ